MPLGCRTADDDWGNWTPEGLKEEQTHDEYWLAQGWTKAQIDSWRETRRAKAKKKRDREKEKKNQTWEREMMFQNDPREVWEVVAVDESLGYFKFHLVLCVALSCIMASHWIDTGPME